MNSNKIGISHLPNQRYRTFCHKGIDYNIMICGPSGVGKTSFINMILDNNILLENIPKTSSEKFTYETKTIEVLSENNSTEKETKIEPYDDSFDINFQITNVHIVDKKFNVRLSITEVDKLGEKINNKGSWDIITKYIQDNFLDFYKKETKNVASMIKDNRIHVCLYFIDAVTSNITPLDTIMIKKISKICNVIIVIARSDVLSDAEKIHIAESCRKMLDTESIHLSDPRVINLSRKLQENQPFFIISGEKTENNKYIRDLSYGRIIIDLPNLEGVKELKKMIVEENVLDLIESTRTHYEIWKAKYISKDFLHEEGESKNNDRIIMEDLIEDIKNNQDDLSEKIQELIAERNLLKQRLAEQKN